MTDAIKMCKLAEPLYKDSIESVFEVDDRIWVPLDPQPCCENCESGKCPINRYGDVNDPTFFCSYWKAKE